VLAFPPRFSGLKPIPYQRRSRFGRRGFGVIDSVEGLLELGESYNVRGMRVSWDPDGTDYAREVVRLLKQVEDEGFIKATLHKHIYEGRELVQLTALSLTVKGHEHLRLLRERAGFHRVKKRLADIAWVVATSAVTTVVMRLKGCGG